MREFPQDGRIGLSFERLTLQPGLAHVYTTRDRQGGGNLSLSGARDADSAVKERVYWCERLGLNPADLVVCGQSHGNGIALVDDSDRGCGAFSPLTVIPDKDGLITQTVGLPLYVASADCASILIYGAPKSSQNGDSAVASDKPILGAFHAGWRGLAAGILTEAVQQMAAISSRPASSFEAGISPCIGLKSFEVGAEVADAAPDNRRVKIQGRWHVDLAGWAHEQLKNAGLLDGQIEIAGLDTFDQDRLFFSHRRDGGETGRMGFIASLCP